ncbi:hypothetical protein PRIPAC_80904, partial [Pristionchus pacificus]
MFASLYGRTCQRVIDEPGLIDKLRTEKYDVYITENFDVCGIGLAKAIEAKAVIGSTTTCLFGLQFEEFGIEHAYSYRPSLFSSSLDVHSFFSRLWNILGELHMRITFSYAKSAADSVLKEKFGMDYPTISYWEEILNRRPRTILLSFGSMAKSVLLSEANKAGILKAIGQFPDVTFIWKYEKPDDKFCRTYASKIKNLVITKWMPQVDILNHKNLALFITHGGMGSTQETALRGVPGIFVPIFGDQPRNAGMMQFNGLGQVYDKFELHNGEKLASTIKEVLENKKYADNAQRLSKMLAKKPFSSRELLIKYVEFAAEFGSSSALRPQSVDMSMIEYHNLDIIAPILFF